MFQQLDEQAGCRDEKCQPDIDRNKDPIGGFKFVFY
jgi:hypothetical protein